MAGEAAIGAVQEDLVTTEDAGEDEAVAQIGGLYASADGRLQRGSRPACQVMGVEIHGHEVDQSASAATLYISQPSLVGILPFDCRSV